MAYFALLWKARTIEKYRLNYEKEKLNSIRIMNVQNPKIKTKTIYQRLCNYNCNTKKKISKTFIKHYPKGSPVYNFLYYLKTDQTFPNFVMKSVIGLVGGIILTYLCFMFFVFQLSISLIHSTIMSAIIGVLLTLGLAFSYRIRCLVFLLIPQFFSRVGRYTLTCYALVLILTGPATNTLKNSEVLSESLACAEEQVKTNMHQINMSVKKPYNSMKESIGLLVDGVKQLAKKIKMMTIRLHRLTLSLAYSLQSSFNWLNSVSESCNRNLGTPYQRCQEVIKNSILECQASLGPWYSWMCDAAKLSQAVCLPAMPLKGFCHVLDFSNTNILGVVTQKLKTFSERINSMLYLEVHVHHSYSFNSNTSRSASQVAAGIVTEIRTRADMFLTWLSWSSCVTSLSLLLIIFRAKYYQHMYETRSRFDNRYVTKELIDLDLKKFRQEKETILPLNRREEGKYIKTTSFRLVSSEKVHLSRSAVTMALTTFKLTIHMVADYSLYWVLMTIRHHGLYQTPLKPGNPGAGTHVAGSALISKLLKSLVDVVTIPLATPPPSIIACLPNPHPPDFHRYFQIGILICLLWFFALFEPYGLRFRHVIMGMYRPGRAKARAVWLFNHIQRTRGSFIKFARRKLHLEYKYCSDKEQTFRYWLQTHIPCVWLKTFLGIYPDDSYCFLCGIMESCNECDGTLVRCDTPGCPGTYCTKCFSDIGQLCTICLSPADYGDLSDVSLEKGSSGESGDDDDDDDSFGSPKPSSSPTYFTFQIEEEENKLLPKKQMTKKSGWFFSTKNKTKEQNDTPLCDSDDEDGEENNVKEKTVCKALLVRHKKFTELDLQNEQRKYRLSLGEDAACSNHCKLCTDTRIDNKLQHVMHCSVYNQTNADKETHRKQKAPKRKNATFYNSLKQSQQSSSLDESIARFKQRFRKMRKYAFKRRFSHPIIRARSNRVLLIRTPSSLRSRQYCRKQRKRFNPITRTRKATNLLQHNISPKVRLKSKREIRKKNKKFQLGCKLMKFLSSFGRLCKNNVQQNHSHISKKHDKYFCFKEKDILDTSNIMIIKCKDDAISERTKYLEEKNVLDASKIIIVKNKNDAISGSSKILEEKDILNVSKIIIVKCKDDAIPGPSKVQEEKDILDASKIKIIKCKDDAISGPSKIQEEKTKEKKKKPSNIKKDKKKEEITTNLVDSKETNKKIGKLHSIYSTYWKNGKLFIPRTKIVNYFRSDDVPALYNKTNHKKRKKVESLQENKVNLYKNKEENEATRQYRISTYLSDQDWMKKECKEPKPQFNDEIEIETKKKQELYFVDTIETEILFKKEQNITNVPNNNTKTNIPEAIRSPKAKNKENKHTRHKKVNRPVNKLQPENRRKISDITPEDMQKVHRVMKKIIELKEDCSNSCNTPKFNGTITLRKAWGTPSPKTRSTPLQPTKPCHVSPRSMEYFRSTGNYDFDPFIEPKKSNAKKVLEKQTEQKPVLIDLQHEDPIEKEIHARVSVNDANAQTKYECLTENGHAAKMRSNKVINSQFGNMNASVMTPKAVDDQANIFEKPSPSYFMTSNKLNMDKNESIKSKKSHNFFTKMLQWRHAIPLKATKKLNSNNNKTSKHLKVDTGINVQPLVENSGCQYGETMPILDKTTQVAQTKEIGQNVPQDMDMFRDVGIDAVTKMRNGATQYTTSLRNASTYFQCKKHRHKPQTKDASTIHYNALKKDSEKQTMTYSESHHNFGIQCNTIVPKSIVKNSTKAHVLNDERQRKIRSIMQQQLDELPLSTVDEIQPQIIQPPKFTTTETCPNISGEYARKKGIGTRQDITIKKIEETKPFNKNIKATLKTVEIKPPVKVIDITNIEKGTSPTDTQEISEECPVCGCYSSSGTSSSLGVLQSLPSMEGKEPSNSKVGDDDNEELKGDEGNIEWDDITSKETNDTAKTDTTVFTILSSVERGENNKPKLPSPCRRLKLKVITKSNRGTTTESTKLCDVSTVTSDWWSPLVERKSKIAVLPKAQPANRILKDKGILTAGRIVSFKSNAEIIPSRTTQYLDILSPARYLLESQKYYNELFSSKLYLNESSPEVSERNSSEIKYSPRRYFLKIRKNYHKYKTKKYDVFQPHNKLPFMEQVWIAEGNTLNSPSLSNYRKTKSSVKLKHNVVPSTRGIQNRGVKKKHPHRYSIKKPELKTKKAEIDLLKCRRYLSSDHLTLDSHGTSHCNSTTEISSL